MVRILMISFLLPGMILAQWSTSGSSIYYNSGNVGIGTASPGQLLAVGSSNPLTVSSTGAVVVNGGISSPTGGYLNEAYGGGATASGGYTLAVGPQATANGEFSVAVGANASTGTSIESTAVGSGAIANGGSAFGYAATASGGGGALALSGTAATARSIAIGYDSTTASTNSVSEYSIALGWGTAAQGNGSEAIGALTTTGPYDSGSIAMGYYASTSGPGQLVVGSWAAPINNIYLGAGGLHRQPLPRND